MELRRKVSEINSNDTDYPRFYLVGDEVPLALEVRFPKVRYRMAALYEQFADHVDSWLLASHSAMIVTSDQRQLMEGIISLKINTTTKSFKDQYILVTAQLISDTLTQFGPH